MRGDVREGNVAVLGKHGRDHVDDNVPEVSADRVVHSQLGLVGSGRVDKDVFRLARDNLGVCG